MLVGYVGLGRAPGPMGPGFCERLRNDLLNQKKSRFARARARGPLAIGRLAYFERKGPSLAQAGGVKLSFGGYLWKTGRILTPGKFGYVGRAYGSWLFANAYVVIF